MNQERYQLEVENSLLYFLITLQKLHLCINVMEIMMFNSRAVKTFVPRNSAHLRKPEAVLVL